MIFSRARADPLGRSAAIGVARRSIDGTGVLALAFGVRLAIVLASNGGLSGYFGYDGGVYYAAADALTFGRVPYRDFVMIHPPGIAYFLAPFALLGRATTDHVGLMAATVGMHLVGAVTAVLVQRTARQLGCDRGAALLGGGLYAIWWGSVGAELGIRLEPVGNLAFAAGLYAVTRRGARNAAVAPWVAGLALGAAVCVKVWWAAPVLAVVAWRRHADGRRTALRIVGGIAAAIAALLGPMLAQAPSWTWRRIVLDQLGRPRSGNSADRLAELTGVSRGWPALEGAGRTFVLAAVVLAVAGAAAGAARVGRRRFLPLLLAGQTAVIFGAPSFFPFYADYLAVPLALTVAAAAAGRRLADALSRLGAYSAVVLVTAAAFATTVIATQHSATLIPPFPSDRLAKQLRSVHCLQSDSPNVLILLNRLSSDLGRGCPVWVDVTGRTYDVDRAPDDRAPRTTNHRWQADLCRYLLADDAVITVRPGTGVGPYLHEVLAALPPIATAGRYRVLAVGAAARYCPIGNANQDGAG